MKHALKAIAILAMLLWVVSCGRENSIELTSPETTTSHLGKAGGQAYSDYEDGAAPEGSGVSEAPITVQGNLQVYTSRASFECDLTSTDFEGSKLPPFSVGVCGPLSSAANECYAAGTIPDGILLTALLPGVPEQMAVLTEGFLGLSNTAVGPNFFSADLVMSFSSGDVNAVGMEILDPFGPTTVNLYVFGPNKTLLGIVTVTSGRTNGKFIALFSPFSPITNINFDQLDSFGGELVDNVSFGSCERN